MSNPVKIALSSIIALVLVCAGAYYFFFVQPVLSPSQLQQQKVDNATQAGRQLLNDWSGSSAIPWLEEARLQAVDSAQKARIDVNLGSAYVQSGMTKKGITIWKQVS